ncbi:MAG: hypothetical protein JOS17DRAFT_14791 [Linnemannia elongata]|nr:MAG: hypothetical protein JOS17DRAFT_14791 [Linnemannia elongata]
MSANRVAPGLVRLLKKSQRRGGEHCSPIYVSKRNSFILGLLYFSPFNCLFICELWTLHIHMLATLSSKSALFCILWSCFPPVIYPMSLLPRFYSLYSLLLPPSPLYPLFLSPHYQKVDPRFHFCNTYSYSISFSLSYSQIAVIELPFFCIYFFFVSSFIPHSVCSNFLSFAFAFPPFLHSHFHSSRSRLTDLCLPSGSFLPFFTHSNYSPLTPNPQCIHQVLQPTIVGHPPTHFQLGSGTVSPTDTPQTRMDQSPTPLCFPSTIPQTKRVHTPPSLDLPYLSFLPSFDNSYLFSQTS